MKRNIRKNKKLIRYIAIFLLLTMIISGCGKREEDFDIDYYGGSEKTGDVVEGIEADDMSDENDISDEDEVSTDNSGSDIGPLADRLGGKELIFNDSLNVNGAAININLKYIASEDITSIPTFRGSPIRENDVNEEEIVKNIFGDTAVALSGSNERKMEEKSDKESPQIISDMQTLVFRYVRDSEYVNYLNLSSWIEKNDYYLHVYEGEYHGSNYQLLIGYWESYNELFISLYPKDFSEVLNDSSIDTYSLVDDKGLFGQTQGAAPKLYTLEEISQGRPNECKKSEEELLNLCDEELKTKLNIYLPENSLTLNSSTSQMMGVDIDNGKTDQRTEVVFFNEAELHAANYDHVRRRGYATIVRFGCNGISLIPGFETVGLYDQMYGMIVLDDNGIEAMSMPVTYKCEDILTEDSTLIKFDKAMEALENALENEVNLKGITKINFDYMELNYFPVKSPDNPDEYTFVPAWVIYGDNKSDDLVRVVINAIDGSLLQDTINSR